MKFSIITVSFNSAATIGKTLDSIAAQRNIDCEHIVIDGSSTDGTQDIVRSHASVTQFLSEKDRGIYDAMNKGIALATGDIIAFLNADDYYAHPNVLSHVQNIFLKTNVTAVLGDVGFFRANAPERIIRRYNSGRFSPKKIAWGMMPAHPAFFLKRDTYTRLGSFKTNYRIAADYEFMARAFIQGEITYIHLPEILVKMQLGGISTANWKNRILLNHEVLRACRENNVATNWLKILSKYPFKLLELAIR